MDKSPSTVLPAKKISLVVLAFLAPAFLFTQFKSWLDYSTHNDWDGTYWTLTVSYRDGTTKTFPHCPHARFGKDWLNYEGSAGQMHMVTGFQGLCFSQDLFLTNSAHASTAKR